MDRCRSRSTPEHCCPSALPCPALPCLASPRLASPRKLFSNLFYCCTVSNSEQPMCAAMSSCHQPHQSHHQPLTPLCCLHAMTSPSSPSSHPSHPQPHPSTPPQCYFYGSHHPPFPRSKDVLLARTETLCLKLSGTFPQCTLSVSQGCHQCPSRVLCPLWAVDWQPSGHGQAGWPAGRPAGSCSRPACRPVYSASCPDCQMLGGHRNKCNL